MVTADDRVCSWTSPHPADAEERARQLALDATGVAYSVAPGCYLREACAELHEYCPAAPERDPRSAEARLAGRAPVKTYAAAAEEVPGA